MKRLFEWLKHLGLYIYGNALSVFSVDPIPTQKISVVSNNIKFYADTPNTIIYYNSDLKEGFFRECRLHSSRKEYLKLLLDDYCTYVFCNEHSKECRRYLEEDLRTMTSFNRFFNMGAGTATYTRITKFRKTGNSKYIGIKRGDRPQWYYDQLLSLVQFAWGPLDEYKYCLLTNKKYQTYNSLKTRLTYDIARYFSWDGIPDSEYIELVIDGKSRFGISVDKVNGIDPTVINDSEIILSYSIQRELCKMHLMDLICFQKDHRAGNYFLLMDSSGIVDKLGAFDNDCPSAFFSTRHVDFSSYNGCSPMIKNNRYYRHYIDKLMAEQLIEFDNKLFVNTFRLDTPKLALKFILKRIYALKEILNKGIKDGSIICLTDSEWSSETVKEELSGEYGNTYLCDLISLLRKKGVEIKWKNTMR